MMEWPYRNNPDRQSRRGCLSRLFIIGLIALFGIITYYSQGQDNPVTGQRQYVSLTPNEEIKLGLQSAPEMALQMGGELPESDPRTQEVQRIGDLIINKTQARKGPWQFKFHLLSDDKTINAFALPGGQIFITLGLYNKLQNEAQLAGVLSHEVGHVIERHTAEQMAKSQLGQMLVLAVGAGSSDSQSSNTPMIIASVVNQMFQLRYSRQDESEADTWGIKLMVESGFNPKALIDVMKILKEASGHRETVDMFQTHPNPDLRIQQIEAYLKEHRVNTNLSDGKALVH